MGCNRDLILTCNCAFMSLQKCILFTLPQYVGKGDKLLESFCSKTRIFAVEIVTVFTSSCDTF